MNKDKSFPISDGFEIMPITEMKVPRFWELPKGQDPVKATDFVNGQETIFLMIASYRDFQCHETITSAFSRADHPERLYVGAVDQVVAIAVEVPHIMVAVMLVVEVVPTILEATRAMP